MKDVSRREFIKQIATTTTCAAGLLVANRGVLSLPKAGFLEDSRPFEILVVGDSIASGQGLREKNKSYHLVKEWIQQEVFGSSRQVNLTVKAHSGSRIYLHEDELKTFLEAEDDVNKFHHREVNISFPSIQMQIDEARKEHERAESVDLILLSGGITDVTVANLINPFTKPDKLRELIHKYCNQAMRGLLEQATAAFPNANVALIGYFPIISTKSDVNKISRFFLKTVKFPHPLQWTLTNDLSRQFMKILRKKMARNSRLWVDESSREMREAVQMVNAKFVKPRIFFVETPITEDACYATKNSLLWQTDDDNLPNDEMYKERKIQCRAAFREIKSRYYGSLSLRLCELMGIGHPNVEGARAYAEAIKINLKQNIFYQTGR